MRICKTFTFLSSFIVLFYNCSLPADDEDEGNPEEDNTTSELPWEGETDKFTINSKEGLRLNDPQENAGTAYVTVTLGNKSASCKITVKKPVLNLKNKAITLKKGSSYTISCSAVPTGKITYKSSNTKCVTVNTKGKITARQKGTATVSIKCNGITQKLKVTVK